MVFSLHAMRHMHSVYSTFMSLWLKELGVGRNFCRSCLPWSWLVSRPISWRKSMSSSRKVSVWSITCRINGTTSISFHVSPSISSSLLTACQANPLAQKMKSSSGRGLHISCKPQQAWWCVWRLSTSWESLDRLASSSTCSPTFSLDANISSLCSFSLCSPLDVHLESLVSPGMTGRSSLGSITPTC